MTDGGIRTCQAICCVQAKLLGVDLRLQPPGMQRRQANSTCCNRRRQSFAWHLEWRFPGAPGCPVVHCRCCMPDSKALTAH